MAKILVVDDEDMLRSMINQALTKDGHEIVEAKNGVQALEKIQAGGFELVITDLVMPDKNGLDLIMELQNNYQLPIIAISGGGGIDSNYDYLTVAKLIGADSIFSKPLNLASFRAEVEKCLAGA